MAGVTLEQVTKTFRTKRGEVRAVDDLNLTVADRELIVLVGPSGCGKTTTLRLIAGLEETTAGTIRIGDRVVNNVAPNQRDIAMVFQSYALYPHMTVFANLAFGLKMRRTAKREIRRRVGEVAHMLGIEPLLDRKPAALSGGERQRVALGRAIVRTPKVFLFDEPLSNLDARLRVQMRTEIKRLHHDLQATIIHVTHDQEEAMTLGDRLVILKDGVIQQCGAPLDLYDRPANRFVAEFIGKPTMNFLEGTLECDGQTTCFAAGIGRLIIPPESYGGVKRKDHERLVLGIRPENVRLVDVEGASRSDDVFDREAGLTTIGEMCVRVVEPLGDSVNVHVVSPAGETVVAKVPPTVKVSPGQRVTLHLDLSCIHVFTPGKNGERLN